MLCIVGEKSCQVREIPSAARILVRNQVVLHSLNVGAELQCMNAERPERVVGELIIIKSMIKVGSRSDTPLIPRISADSHHGRSFPRHATQRR